jgi:hypothetical protein
LLATPVLSALRLCRLLGLTGFRAPEAPTSDDPSNSVKGLACHEFSAVITKS